MYFGKKVADLTLAECATLAGLVRGPSIYNPVYSPEAAAKVRNATLERMFECEFITQEQLWQALREPMAVAGKREARPGSYPVLVVSRELGDLDCCDEQEGTSSIFVMTTLDLEFQRMVEDVSEPMLAALESSSVWAGLPKRVDNQLNRCVQAAILCVDSRKGELLAVTGGRSAQDGLDRWQSRVMPGDLFTPIVNLCAVDQRRTVIRSNPEVTGRGVGFNTVIETAQKAGYKGELPRSSDLYTGRFSVPLSHAVNALYLIGNDGLNVSISSVRQVGTTKKNLVMVNAPSPEERRREILPRESAHLVASLPPFRYDERTRKTFVNVKLPGNTGHFSAVMGRYFTVFAWVGFDSPEAAVYEKKGVSAALAKTCSSLAGEVYDRAEEGRRKAVRERRERENAAEQGPQ